MRPVILKCSYISSTHITDCQKYEGLVATNGAAMVWLETTVGPPGKAKTIKVIQEDDYINDLDMNELCSHLKGIQDILHDNDWKKYRGTSDQTNIKALFKKYCDALKNALPTKSLSAKEKCIKDNFGDDKDKYNDAVDDCKKINGKKWSNSRCACVDEPKQSKEIVGCLDEDAVNYWCDLPGNDCTGGVPANIQPGGCKYESKIPLAYNYSFCNDKKGCDEINLKSGSYPVISYRKKGLSSMYKGFKEKVTNLVEEGYSVESREGIFLPINDAPSFYGTPNENDIKDLARALTIQTNNTCDTNFTFPFTFVTMYGTDGITPLGQFKIKVNPSKEVSCLDRIEKLIPWESSLTTKDRIISLLQNNPSANTPITVDLEQLAAYKRNVDWLNEIFQNWNIPVYVNADGELKYTGTGNDSKIIKQQKNDGSFDPGQYQRLYNSIEGLNNVLLEKPEGLITALK